MARLALLLVLLGTATAHAQEPAAEPKLFVGGSATVWLPQGDADDTSDTSLGVRPVVGYWLRPFIAIIGAFDYIFVNEDANASDATFYSISLGARMTTPKPAQLKPYGELLLGRYTLDADNLDDSQSDIGFRIGGGATYAMGDNVVFTAGLGYSSVSIDVAFGDIDIDALVLEVGLQGRF
jgi:hypothetical protein